MTLHGVVDQLSDDPGGARLDRDECMQRLASTDRGRVAVSIGALPAIVSVRYVVAGDHVVFPVRDDELWRATDDHVVAFNADGVDECGHAWAVGLVGHARHLTSDGHRLAALSAERISGQREFSASPSLATEPPRQET